MDYVQPFQQASDLVARTRRKGHFRTWFRRDDWDERIISFNASWFTCSMGTGAVAQVWTNFPYHAEWQQTLAYCFWVRNSLRWNKM